jgi:hypothetical protein
MPSMPYTFVKKISFKIHHPNIEDEPIVRTLTVSDTVLVPENHQGQDQTRNTSLESFDYRDPADLSKIHRLIRLELIRSKTDGLSPAGISEVMRTVGESEIEIIATSSDRVASRWAARFGVKVTMRGREDRSLWYAPGLKDHPIVTYVPSNWTGVGESYFYENCAFVSKIVAAGKAEDLIRRWKDLGLEQSPVKVDVQEIYYARQVIQLSTEMQADEMYDGVNAFATYNATNLLL